MRISITLSYIIWCGPSFGLSTSPLTVFFNPNKKQSGPLNLSQSPIKLGSHFFISHTIFLNTLYLLSHTFILFFILTTILFCYREQSNVNYN